MSMRYKGGVISATPPTVSTASAKGLWTLEQQLQYQAAGVWPVQYIPTYIEDTFSTYLYTGTGATQTITNGIDLSGNGGLVWIKGRSGATGHRFTDTARGATKSLASNSTAAETTESTGLTAFGSTGFTIGADADYNTNAATYVSWAFREQAKFFDVVTYTGNGAATREILHNLGSTPGFIIVKKTSSTGRWLCWHRTFPQDGTYILLNATSAAGASSPAIFTTTVPTSTGFYVSYDAGRNSDFDPNINGQTYVAYIFAHNAGGFGASGSDNVISCGSYTGNGSATGPVVTLGYEPQWLIVKRSDGAGTWYLVDTMRGWVVDGNDSILEANGSGAEYTGTVITPTATGFQLNTTNSEYNASGGTYIYIAIRRGPMKTPTSGTSVFSPVAYTSTSTNSRVITSSIVPDSIFWTRRDDATDKYWYDRLRGNGSGLKTNTTQSQSSVDTAYGAQFNSVQTGYAQGTSDGGFLNSSTYTNINYLFQRAPGFFDVVCFTSSSLGTLNVSHNLTVAPEFIITKARNSSSYSWFCYHKDLGVNKYVALNSTAAETSYTPMWVNAPTSTQFSLSVNDVVPTSANNVAYLFATVSGVSKVGSYTGTGTTKQIDCGFTGGARFVLIKRTDSTGDWYVWDSARGIVAGNDPYLLLNSTAAEVTNTDYVDTFAAGFEISSTAPAAINANGGTFIFLAIA
jgi:hypothetical protein